MRSDRVVAIDVGGIRRYEWEAEVAALKLRVGETEQWQHRVLAPAEEDLHGGAFRHEAEATGVINVPGRRVLVVLARERRLYVQHV